MTNGQRVALIDTLTGQGADMRLRHDRRTTLLVSAATTLIVVSTAVAWTAWRLSPEPATRSASAGGTGEATDLVGRGKIEVEVPRGWSIDRLMCGQPTEPTVGFIDSRQPLCTALVQRSVDGIVLGDIDSGTAAADQPRSDLDGYEVFESRPAERGPVWVQEFTIPDLDVRVIVQSPARDDLGRLFERVKVSERNYMPSLIGTTVSDARMITSQMGIRIDLSAKAAADALIAVTSPEAGRPVKAGQPVEVSVEIS